MYFSNNNMIIATPISHLFKDKNKAEKIIKFSDCLEVRERNLGLDFDKEYLIHLDGDIHFKWDQNYKNYLKKIFKRKKKLKLISLQMTRCCTGHVIKNNFFQLSGKRLNKNDMKFNAKKNISWLKNLFVKKKINFAIENNNYYPLEAYDIIADPKFISEIVNENKINFLFDIAHAKVSASNMNIDFKKYIDELPMSKMIQIHICKPYISKKRFR